MTRTILMGYPRFRMDYESGIFYLGKQRFSRAHWAYPFLPKWMRIQGRAAKEGFSVLNNALWEVLKEGDHKFHVRRVCDAPGCFGRLVVDPTYRCHYCEKCGLFAESVTIVPGLDSISQSSPMNDHYYIDPKSTTPA